MKRRWIAVAVAGVLAGCSKDKPAPNAGVLPGTEPLQSLLAGVGTSVRPSADTGLALGGLFGKSGVLGAGAPLGMPLAGQPNAPDPATVAIARVPVASSGGDCAAVAHHLAEAVRAQASAQLGSDADARKIADPMIDRVVAKMTGEVQHACESQSWTRELKDCVLTANTPADMQSCEKYVTPDMRAQAKAQMAHPPAVPRPSTPAPKWAGGTPDCAAVAAHAAAVAEWQLSAAPPEFRVPELVAQLKTGVETACGAGHWTEELRRCVLDAGSADAMNACSTKI